MQEAQKKAQVLAKQLDEALDRIGFKKMTADYGKLLKQSKDPNLWSNQAHAQTVMKQQAALSERLKPWQLLAEDVHEAVEMASLQDEAMSADLNQHIDKLQKRFDELKKELQFSGPFDDHNVIVSIHAGAGGTDAQDWAQMLLRMYVRWAERQGFQVQTIEQTAGEEAGIKSAIIEMSGSFVYGKLKGEHGVHRLVRLSPYNADHLRQTSFAKVEVLPELAQPTELALDDKDLKIDVFRAGGHGGQSVNTTDSAVRVTHIPTGITVSIQNERSQLQNKERALTILRSRLAQLQLEQHKEQVSELKGPNQSAEWGNQIRSYVLHPYKQVKDLRTQYESSDPDAVLDGELEPVIDAYLEHSLS